MCSLKIVLQLCAIDLGNINNDFKILKILFLFLVMFMCVCVYICHLLVGNSGGQKKVFNAQELELQPGVCCQTHILMNGHRASEKIETSLKHCHLCSP